MDVVDLARARHRAGRRNIRRRAAERDEGTAFGGVGAGDPGADRIDHMQPRDRPRRRRDSAANAVGDERGHGFKRGHGALWSTASPPAAQRIG
jgi:hypothetical protein